MEVREMLIPKGHPNRPGIKLESLDAIIIHYTANSNRTATDSANIRYMGRKYIEKDGKYYEADGKRRFRYGSAHIFCDEDSCSMGIPLDEVAWAVGDRHLPYDNGYRGQTRIAHERFNHRQNYRTVSIEICNNGDWDRAVENALEVVVDIILDNPHLTINDILRHGDLTGKNCPKPFMENEKDWEEFKKRVWEKVQQKREGMEKDMLFNDMEDISHWAKTHVISLAEKGILKGDDKGNFNPKDYITREMASVIVDRSIKYILDEFENRLKEIEKK